MNIARMTEWIANHNVGVSSRTMWSALMGVRCDHNDHPYDADDFSRCYDLYMFCELTHIDLQQVVSVYPYWRPIIEHWDELCAMYAKKDYHGIYEALNSMRDKIMEIKGYTKIREGYWVKKKK